jgi:hypothetical protein
MLADGMRSLSRSRSNWAKAERMVRNNLAMPLPDKSSAPPFKSRR